MSSSEITSIHSLHVLESFQNNNSGSSHTLPHEILVHIFSNLELNDLKAVELASKGFREATFEVVRNIEKERVNKIFSDFIVDPVQRETLQNIRNNIKNADYNSIRKTFIDHLRSGTNDENQIINIYVGYFISLIKENKFTEAFNLLNENHKFTNKHSLYDNILRQATNYFHKNTISFKTSEVIIAAINKNTTFIEAEKIFTDYHTLKTKVLEENNKRVITALQNEDSIVEEDKATLNRDDTSELSEEIIDEFELMYEELEKYTDDIINPASQLMEIKYHFVIYASQQIDPHARMEYITKNLSTSLQQQFLNPMLLLIQMQQAHNVLD